MLRSALHQALRRGPLAAGARRRASGAAPLTYYSAWFCPFAHRATIALEHHGLEYEWVEALGWEQRAATGDEDHDAGDRDDWWYHWKHPDLLEANPEGMVPTLRAGDAVCTESIVRAGASRGRGRRSDACPFPPW